MPLPKFHHLTCRRNYRQGSTSILRTLTSVGASPPLLKDLMLWFWAIPPPSRHHHGFSKDPIKRSSSLRSFSLSSLQNHHHLSSLLLQYHLLSPTLIFSLYISFAQSLIDFLARSRASISSQILAKRHNQTQTCIMHFSNAILATSILAVSAMAGPLAVRDNDQGLKPICKHLKTENEGCVRCKSLILFHKAQRTMLTHMNQIPEALTSPAW